MTQTTGTQLRLSGVAVLVLELSCAPCQGDPVAHDAELAGRVRALLPDRADLREVRMFGGLAFMVDDAMVACVSAGGGALLVRVSRARDAEYLAVAGAHRAEMGRGRSMGEGWIAVDADAVAADDDLRFWVDAVLEHRADGT